jgi:hypothetical protein
MDKETTGFHHKAQIIILKLAQPLQQKAGFGPLDTAPLHKRLFLFIELRRFDTPLRKDTPISTSAVCILFEWQLPLNASSLWCEAQSRQHKLRRFREGAANSLGMFLK